MVHTLHYNLKPTMLALCFLGISVLSGQAHAIAFESMVESEPFKRGDVPEVKHLVEETGFFSHTSNLTIVEALYFAISSGNLKLVKYLASQGWLSICKSESYCFPIHVAAKQEFRFSKPMIKYFMSQGFSPYVLDQGGGTPLHRAANFGHAKLVRYLCEIGVDASIKNKYDQKTALDVALISSMARQHSNDPEEDAAIRVGLKDTIDYLKSGQCKKK